MKKINIFFDTLADFQVRALKIGVSFLNYAGIILLKKSSKYINFIPFF